jgi:hypothetical protein
MFVTVNYQMLSEFGYYPSKIVLEIEEFTLTEIRRSLLKSLRISDDASATIDILTATVSVIDIPAQ